MKTFEKIVENAQINSWIQNFARSPEKINLPHETDAELLRIPGNEDDYLAVTIDAVTEEISAGLYREPFTMGWVAIMANFSDLAAVGASPLGIVTAVSLQENQYDRVKTFEFSQHDTPKRFNSVDRIRKPRRSGSLPDNSGWKHNDFNQKIAQGMNAACTELGTFILGGDINYAAETSLTGCAIGTVPKKEFVTRKGCKAGDLVFLTSHAGMGSALGLFRFANLPDTPFSESLYRPVARIREGRLIRKFASACMDTSDGVLTTLDQLMRINGAGFKLTANLKDVIHPAALKLAQVTQLPEWTLLAGHHGEFELIFTVPAVKVEEFLSTAKKQNWQPLKIGEVVAEENISLKENEETYELNTERIRNLFVESEGDMKYYISEVTKCFST